VSDRLGTKWKKEVVPNLVALIPVSLKYKLNHEKKNKLGYLAPMQRFET
jgi:hypothetical protein